MYISTLRRFIEPIGGELEIVARFADHNVKIKNFADLNEKVAPSSPGRSSHPTS
jgi:hypothetical protein